MKKSANKILLCNKKMGSSVLLSILLQKKVYGIEYYELCKNYFRYFSRACLHVRT